MENNNQPIEDIQHIRSIMERSTTFVSLTGWSGIVTGIVGLITFFLAIKIFGTAILYFDTFKDINPYNDSKIELVILALSALSVSLITAFLLTQKRAKRNNQSIWDSVSKNFAISLFTPLIVGGFFIIAQARIGYFEFICSSMLLFFGMALLNASKYVKPGMMKLAIMELLLGVAAAFWVQFGLIFWALGFGVAILIYGILMYLKYER